ncbi:acetyl-CoA carboxylase biotin carboxyl carrier protein [Thermogemmatispora sp.]|uniref:acetyl-CoA carboxylase biotin carboxyl carrier protein n=1 Tax=Thermogemmatispora sp. TaxID=1968838 RepID=UPI001D984349|nr:biotin/lipoyl-containing protein [Thermogemmatispora sp.]MBX5449811.1 biotin/lipoyl-binding protein [Thermogemmatispora sp.]
MEVKASRRGSSRGALENGAASAEALTVEQIKRLVQLLDHSDVSELELRAPMAGLRLALRKARLSGAEGLTATELVDEEVGATEEQPTSATETRHTIVSPWVGIFHRWARPKEQRPVVQLGDQVKVGQLVATVEALNVINEVESPVAGRVAEILVEEGQPVEYGQPLMVIDSSGEA